MRRFVDALVALINFLAGFILADQRCHESVKACINDRSIVDISAGRGEWAPDLEPPLKHPTTAQDPKTTVHPFRPQSDGRIVMIGWGIGTNSQGQDRILTLPIKQASRTISWKRRLPQ